MLIVPSGYFSDKQLAAKFGVGRSTIHRWVAMGEFPKPVKLSQGCTRWRLDDVEAWEQTRAQVSAKEGKV